MSSETTSSNRLGSTKSFQLQVSQFLIDYFKKNSLLKVGEIKNLLLPENFYCANFFFWYAKLTPFSKKEILHLAALLEIIQTALLLHAKVKNSPNEDNNKDNNEDGLSEEDKVKNIKKILAGDILIALSLNLVNEFSQTYLKEIFYRHIKLFFFYKINQEIHEDNSSTKKNSPKQFSLPNLIECLSLWCSYNHPEKRKISYFTKEIIDYLKLQKLQITSPQDKKLDSAFQNSQQKLIDKAQNLEKLFPAMKIVDFLIKEKENQNQKNSKEKSIIYSLV